MLSSIHPYISFIHSSIRCPPAGPVSGDRHLAMTLSLPTRLSLPSLVSFASSPLLMTFSQLPPFNAFLFAHSPASLEKSQLSSALLYSTLIALSNPLTLHRILYTPILCKHLNNHRHYLRHSSSGDPLPPFHCFPFVSLFVRSCGQLCYL